MARSKGPDNPASDSASVLALLRTAVVDEHQVTGRLPPVAADDSGALELQATMPSQKPSTGTGLAVGTMVKHYEIIRELGRGGMGTVFLVRDTKLGRLVALKVLTTYAGDHVQRFLEEARATARCRHQNIVIIHEVGEYQSHEKRSYPFMVLEYIQGQTLRAWLQERQQRAATTMVAPVSPELAVELMVPVVQALVCAHDLGIVHRDLKPENIILDQTGTIKVLDFGIAKQRDHELPPALTRHAGADPNIDDDAKNGDGALMGTLPYMSPEQWYGPDVDARSDLWAVGVMLYELVVGAHPLAPLSRPRLATVADLSRPMPLVVDTHPELGALARVIDQCLHKPLELRVPAARELLDALLPLLPGRQALELDEDDNPFTGLAAFQESDAGRFHGRQREVASMVARLRHHRLGAVAGPSGAGKSSFVRAGVIPALRRSGEHWDTYIVRPGRHPLAALADVLVQVSASGHATRESGASLALAGQLALEAGDRDSVIATLRDQPGFMGAALRRHCRKHRLRLLLFVDQFEELYTLTHDDNERAVFLTCLEGVADDASSPLRVLLTLRSDFLDRVARDRASLASPLMPELTRGLAFLPPMDRDGLRAALTMPVTASNAGFETPDMVEDMLDSLEGTRTPLPLLQFTAARLWDMRERDSALITAESYDRLGGVAGALSTHADAVLAGMSAQDRRITRALFLRLVTPERTRAVVVVDELRELQAASESSAVTRVLQNLADARLVLMEAGDGHGEAATVELVHESLIDSWAQLGQWLDENESDAQFLVRLRNAAREWHASDRAEGLLWRGQAAHAAESWHLGRADTPEQATALGERAERYLAAVIDLARRTRRRRRNIVAVALVGLTIIAVVVSYLAVRASREADRAERQAAHVRGQKVVVEQGATRARNASRMAAAREHQADPTTVLALVREIEPGTRPRGFAELARTALHRGVARAILSHDALVDAAAFSPDGQQVVTGSWDKQVRLFRADGMGAARVIARHDDFVASVAFHPTGRWVASGSFDKTVRLTRTDGRGAPVVLTHHSDFVLSVAFTRDGQRLASSSSDHTAAVLRVQTTGERMTAAEEPPQLLRGHEEAVSSAAFDAEGHRLVTASRDRTARIYQLDGAAEPIVLRGHTDRIYSAAFSPEGRLVVTASADNTARIYRADGTGELRVLRGHSDRLASAEFSPDGARIVTASWDKTARIYNVDGTGAPLVLQGHRNRVMRAEFSPDGNLVVTASADQTARVYDADGRGRPVQLSGHQHSVYWAEFSPDGRRVATGSFDKTARVHNADGTGHPVVLTGHTDMVFSAAFSPDGTHVVTASADGTARVHRADGSGEPIVLGGHSDRLYSARYSPEGQRIVTASFDKTARVHNADGSGEAIVLGGHGGRLYSASFSPDGRWILTVAGDSKVRLFPADGSGPPQVVFAHDDFVLSAAFSPDGTRVITGSADKKAYIHEIGSSAPPLVLRGHEAFVNVRGGRPFSPDGARIVTSADDKTIRVWNSDGSGQPLVLRGPDFAINSAAFSADGRAIVSSSDDHSAWVWRDLTPLRGARDPRLWQASSYCMPVARRQRLLDVPREMAERNHEMCLARVRAVNRGATFSGRPPAGSPSAPAEVTAEETDETTATPQ